MTEKPEMPREFYFKPPFEEGGMYEFCGPINAKATAYIRKDLTPPQDVLEKVYGAFKDLVNAVPEPEMVSMGFDHPPEYRTELDHQIAHMLFNAGVALALLSPYVTRQQENE